MKKFLRLLGPGLLFASMAIGTSHLVLSTKAGAQYGWLMVIPIVLANVLKYPFFEFGVRYTHTYNHSLLQGYASLGEKYLWGYTLLTALSTGTILAALYIVTAGLLKQLFPLLMLSDTQIAFCLFAGIGSILIVGKYKFLERAIKILLATLTAALIITTALVVFKGAAPAVQNFKPLPFFNEIGLLFLIGLMGWMPTAVEASSWVSLWTLEKHKNEKQNSSLKEALQEFNFGYVLTAVLAVFFLIIGWLTLYGSGISMSSNAAVFADQLIQMFTTHIGNWAYYCIALAAFATMFSTCMTVHDALARVSVDSIQILITENKKHSQKFFNASIVVLAVINMSVLWWFKGNMGALVGVATFISFVIAPLIGLLNHKLVTHKKIPPEARPARGLLVLSYAGMLFLSLFAVYYCYVVWG